MAFNIETFKSNFSDGGARPNLFRALITMPSTVSQLPGNGSYLIKSAQIPSATVTAIDVPYFGRQVRVAGNRTFEPWTVTIMNTESFDIRNAMEQWIFGMFPTEISSIELGWENNDTIEEFTVTFAYDYWHHTGAVTN
mgnify:CR=1 FL=1